METSSKKDLTYAMTPLKILAWPVGTWPLQKYNVASFLRSTTAVFVLLLTLALLNTEAYLDGTDAEKNLDSVVLVSCSILAVWKVTQFRVRREGLVSNFQSAVKDYKELDSEEKRTIMRRHAYMSRVAGASVILFAYFSATLIAIVPMFAPGEKETTLNANGTKAKNVNYPVPSEYTLQALHVPDKLFLMVFSLEYLMMLFISNGNLGSDAVFFGITFHLCGQAEILKLEFTKIVNDNENSARRLDALTTRHRHLLKLSKQLNDTISSILVMQVLSSCLLICTTGFQLILSLNAKNFVMEVKTFIVVGTLLTQLFAYSYVGNYLKDQMEGIGYSAYCCRWYDLPNRLSKDIVFILMRSHNPVHLKAGNFFVVNMETYMNINCLLGSTRCSAYNIGIEGCVQV
ncbi:odorant receptor 67a-like [Andrena cerasifolii]|uniref:odorant receptor 67a-like n=1 Tax=Andrena cerasifolii TaxID=2819439 RepID=UPI004037CAAD